MKDYIDGFDPHSEGAFARFDRGFVGRYGPDSVIVRALSDNWTIALARLLYAHDALDPDKPLLLYSNDKAVDAVRELCRKDERLEQALFKEPFGFAPPGTIEEAFGQVFGPDLYDLWLEAFEQEDFDRCSSLVDKKG